MFSDAVPSDKLGTANSVYQAAPLLGIGACSLGLLFIQKMGWRSYMNLTGVVGLVIGALAFLLVKEPENSMKHPDAPAVPE